LHLRLVGEIGPYRRFADAVLGLVHPATTAPSLANRSATARPISLAAPLTRQTFPARREEGTPGL